MKAILLAALAAIAVQPLVLLLWIGVPTLISGGSLPPLSDFGAIAVVTSVVAAPFVVVIGIPCALLLRHHSRRGWWLATIGFIAAALPWAASAPWSEWIVGRTWDRFALMHQLGAMLTFGLHGLVGATVFHRTWRTR